MKEFSFSEGQKFLIVQDFICLEKFDATGRLYSFDKITLTSDQIEKQKKLLSKGSILYLMENDVLLENLTGVNANYLSLLQQMEALNQRLEIISNDIDKIEDLKKQHYFVKKSNSHNFPIKNHHFQSKRMTRKSLVL